MDKPLPRIDVRKPSVAFTVNKSIFSYSERLIKKDFVLSFRARLLALGIFLYYFIENGTLGLFPPSFYYVYRNVRLSDFIQYFLIIYSLVKINEYKELFRSKSFIAAKFILGYLIIQFVLSAIRYKFNVLEYFFRLKGVWSSFLIFPFLLLLQRNGLVFLIKLVLPVAVISNILYIMSALTGNAFLPDVSIITQYLPGGLTVNRVFGGTFFGEFYFLGFIYLWITKKFRVYQLGLAILFIIPHILAFGRTGWVIFLFDILLMIILNSLRKREFKVFLRQSIALGVLLTCIVIAFIKFIPESDYYVDALNARIFEGHQDVKYNEGTYGARVVVQNNSLLKLWSSSDEMILGIGMHPMWVVGPTSLEEQIYYGSFSDVSWAGVLAGYGLVGFVLWGFFQIYYMRTSLRLIRKYREPDLYLFMLIMFLAKLTFDTFIAFSFILFSVNLWGLMGMVSFYTAITVYAYEKNELSETENYKMPGRNGRITNGTS